MGFDAIVQGLLQFGIAGAMAAGLVYMMWYRESVAVPKLLETFAAEMQAERDACERRHGENIAAHARTVEEVKDTRHALKDLENASRVWWAARGGTKGEGTGAPDGQAQPHGS